MQFDYASELAQVRRRTGAEASSYASLDDQRMVGQGGGSSEGPSQREAVSSRPGESYEVDCLAPIIFPGVKTQ